MDLSYIEKYFLKKYSGIQEFSRIERVLRDFYKSGELTFLKVVPRDLYFFFFKKKGLNKIRLLPSEPLMCLMNI